MPKPTDRRSRHETEALERHAAAQLRSEAKRKARNAPRRDDLNRAGYYILLLTILEAEAQGEIERAQRLRRRMRLVLDDAGFAADVSVAVFDQHVRTAIEDLKGWVGMRRIARAKTIAAAETEAP
ncbi:hypothetical protein [Methylobacterium sp. J-077]|uniref:hypothetical protein n=1 Tax=Methylobacterium sp. J-077 TaxID=2836656 RepID=UPI001FB96365|nr:hypothetical protein [Methylobacterium sp. J-077]MCJ2123130.1 hypothetical protein [Methylobacterium sp. J-077]